MNVEVTLTNGVFASYDFDPIYKEDVLAFYSELYRENKIKSYKATMNNGQIVGMGV